MHGVIKNNTICILFRGAEGIAFRENLSSRVLSMKQEPDQRHAHAAALNVRRTEAGRRWWAHPVCNTLVFERARLSQSRVWSPPTSLAIGLLTGDEVSVGLWVTLSKTEGRDAALKFASRVCERLAGRRAGVVGANPHRSASFFTGSCSVISVITAESLLLAAWHFNQGIATFFQPAASWKKAEILDMGDTLQTSTSHQDKTQCMYINHCSLRGSVRRWPMCLLCNKCAATAKDCNLLQHFNIKYTVYLCTRFGCLPAEERPSEIICQFKWDSNSKQQ